MTELNDRELDERLAGLPAEAPPDTDLWPRIRASIDTSAPAAGRAWWINVAAAAALFAGGFMAGQYGSPSQPATPASTAVTPASPPAGVFAAAEIQRAGTAYVVALADLRTSQTQASHEVVMQARDAAVAALGGAAWELTKLGDDTGTAAKILALTEEDRRRRLE